MVTHTMKVVARKTGLSPHVIRVWERRYNAVNPVRTGTNRRVYTEDDVERLSLLARLTEAGHSIGRIAQLPVAVLRRMVQETPFQQPALGGDSSAAGYTQEAIEAIKRLESSTLRNVLERAALKFGTHGLFKEVVAPLTHEIGALWETGVITAANEHFASAILRNFVGSSARPYALPDNAPTLVVATPAGQLHELGAVLVAAAAVDYGWRVIYLGSNLPALEIAGAAIKSRAQAVALSIVYPNDDPYLAEELSTLRRHLPPPVHILVGGRGARAYGEALQRIKALQPIDLDALVNALEAARTGHRGPAATALSA